MKRPYTPKTPSREKLTQEESLQVYCRLRPKVAISESSCVRIISSTTVVLTLPESSVNFRPGACKEYECTFRRVYPESSTQKEIFDDVALPLMEQLIQGRNGLLFTYGVTGSGKTFTMTGVKHNAGVMPRCLDVLFNSVGDYLAPKYTFKPDKMNGFEVQTEEDAQYERDQSLKNAAKKFGRLKKKESNEDLTSSRSKEEGKVNVEEDNAYAVFVTYVEIYNNHIYDLLEDISNGGVASSRFWTNVIREDASGNMYVPGMREIEVTSAEEAFEVFYKGQNRKRMAHTNLNNESSRSHSIFTIRLVQAPLDVNGETVLHDKKFISISQLSLVDLAGSERTNRTRNEGTRLREAGNINNSLMTLRSCLEILRDNQTINTDKKIIPYRDSKLTNLFRNFFEGDGYIRMIVCVNPSVEDYDENIQVMKFAESSQEIKVRPTPVKIDPIGLTPGRRRANREYKRALQILEEVKEGTPLPYIPNDAEVIYSLEPFPLFDNLNLLDGELYKNLSTFLEERIKKREFLRADLMSRVTKFRDALIEQDRNYIKIKQDCDSANAMLGVKDSKTKLLEDKLVAMDSLSSSLKRKCEEYQDEIKRLKRDLDTKDTVICRYNLEKDKEKQKTKKMAAKTEKLAKERENNLKEKQNIEMQLKDRENRLRKVKKVLELESTKTSKIPRMHAGYGSDTESNTTSSSNEAPIPQTPKNTMHLRPRTVKTIAVSNPRYGNKRCNTHDEWLEHRPAVLAPLNTVLQPVLRKRKSLTKVTSPEEIRKTSKYCLINQNQDECGSLETQLFKGDVVPTAGGGAQVIFNDVETLTQTSPTASPRKQILDELNKSIREGNTSRYV